MFNKSLLMQIKKSRWYLAYSCDLLFEYTSQRSTGIIMQQFVSDMDGMLIPVNEPSADDDVMIENLICLIDTDYGLDCFSYILFVLWIYTFGIDGLNYASDVFSFINAGSVGNEVPTNWIDYHGVTNVDHAHILELLCISDAQKFYNRYVQYAVAVLNNAGGSSFGIFIDLFGERLIEKGQYSITYNIDYRNCWNCTYSKAIFSSSGLSEEVVVENDWANRQGFSNMDGDDNAAYYNCIDSTTLASMYTMIKSATLNNQWVHLNLYGNEDPVFNPYISINNVTYSSSDTPPTITGTVTFDETEYAPSIGIFNTSDPNITITNLTGNYNSIEFTVSFTTPVTTPGVYTYTINFLPDTGEEIYMRSTSKTFTITVT